MAHVDPGSQDEHLTTAKNHLWSFFEKLEMQDSGPDRALLLEPPHLRSVTGTLRTPCVVTVAGRGKGTLWPARVADLLFEPIEDDEEARPLLFTSKKDERISRLILARAGLPPAGDGVTEGERQALAGAVSRLSQNELRVAWTPSTPGGLTARLFLDREEADARLIILDHLWEPLRIHPEAPNWMGRILRQVARGHQAFVEDPAWQPQVRLVKSPRGPFRWVPVNWEETVR